jgi:transcriptional regulator GlxA family with amidase domain
MLRYLAMDLLLRTQRPIKQIAGEVGFQNEKSFMRAFKGWTGKTPEGVRSRRPPQFTPHAAPKKQPG